MEQRHLSPDEQKVLEACVKWRKAFGREPRQADIARAVGASTRQVIRWVSRLGWDWFLVESGRQASQPLVCAIAGCVGTPVADGLCRRHLRERVQQDQQDLWKEQEARKADEMIERFNRGHGG